MPRLATVIAVSLCVSTIACHAPAQEWTRFRGPNGQGQSDAAGIRTEWTEKDYNWRVELPGVGNSSPVIWRRKVFVTSADADSATLHVLGLDTTNGQKLWQKDFPSTTHKIHNFNTYASGTPTVDAERLYIASATPEEYWLAALTHDGKNVVWRKSLGPYESQHGFGMSPIVVDGEVIITNDQDGPGSFLIAFDAKTGNERWRLERKHANNRQNASYSTPCILESPQGKELIVCSWAYGISSHDLKTGKENWEAPIFKLRPVSSPVLVAGLILGSEGEGAGNNTVFAIHPGDTKGKTPDVAYSIPKAYAPYVPTMVAAGDLAFLWSDKGLVTCIDASTGKIRIDRQRVGGNYFGSPIRIGDRIYCMSADGDCVVIAATPEFKLLARNALGEGSRATPAVADGRLYLRTDSHLISLGGK
jgi:outer membrane protein assembly factor BamB